MPPAVLLVVSNVEYGEISSARGEVAAEFLSVAGGVEAAATRSIVSQNDTFREKSENRSRLTGDLGGSGVVVRLSSTATDNAGGRGRPGSIFLRSRLFSLFLPRILFVCLAFISVLLKWMVCVLLRTLVLLCRTGKVGQVVLVAGKERKEKATINDYFCVL